MKTYEDNGYRYFYDFYIKSWTIYEIDLEGFQVGNADYFSNKKQLIISYPTLKFIKEEELA